MRRVALCGCTVLLMAALAGWPALAAADVPAPPSLTPTPTSPSPGVVPGASSGSGGGLSTPVIAGIAGVGVLAVAAASWLVLRRIAAARGGPPRTEPVAAPGDDSEGGT